MSKFWNVFAIILEKVNGFELIPGYIIYNTINTVYKMPHIANIKLCKGFFATHRLIMSECTEFAWALQIKV